MDINILLFDEFTTLDAFGPVEVLGSVAEWRLRFVSMDGGIIRSHQGVEVLTQAVASQDLGAAWLVPGGWGTRQLVKDQRFMTLVGRLAEESTYCLSVCTGAALLARCGSLDGRKATTNHKAFDWVASFGPRVNWQRDVRWVCDGKFYTSAGVSAGVDMALGFVRDRLGRDKAEQIADRMEYAWRE